MNEIYERLTKILLEKNSELSPLRARTWAELLWEDFETTYAKAGREYKGTEMTEKVVRKMIENYGDKLHVFAAKNPKYSHLLEDEEDEIH
ncbi:YfhJ family protein [Bacillus sp. 2205SS5-2]|uniref:YfhJ family protein n=1 Tax=Bacillus sp. 2205SS5-2 TaxID=3109031 RepID=UPI003006448E